MAELFGNDSFDSDEKSDIEDLMFFMDNNTEFYRKIFYPSLRNFRIAVEQGQKISRLSFWRIVNQAADAYCAEFELDDPLEVFPQEARDELSVYIYQRELDALNSPPVTEQCFVETANSLLEVTNGIGAMELMKFYMENPPKELKQMVTDYINQGRKELVMQIIETITGTALPYARGKDGVSELPPAEKREFQKAITIWNRHVSKS